MAARFSNLEIWDSMSIEELAMQIAEAGIEEIPLRISRRTMRIEAALRLNESRSQQERSGKPATMVDALGIGPGADAG